MCIPDNYDAFRYHERKQQEWLERRPVCDECKQHIQDENFYLINDMNICPNCMELYYKKDTEDFCV